MNPSGVTYYYHDKEGSVTQLTNGSGAIIESYRYDVFGAATVKDGNGNVISATAYHNRFLFTGREYVDTFGIYEYRARTYHPGLGRFLSEDPKGFDAGDYNLFRYCMNDPEDHTDPTGMMILPQFMGLIAATPCSDGMRGLNHAEAISLARWHAEAQSKDATIDAAGVPRALPAKNTIGVLGANQAQERPLVRGNDALVQLVNRLGGSTVYRAYLHRTILQLIGMGYTNGTLIGYSRGGVVMVHETGRFSAFQFHVIGIDVARFGRGALTLPSNVTSAENYYQQNPHYDFSANGNSFAGTPLTSDYINVHNYNFTGDARYTHGNIVEMVSDRIVNGD